MKGLFYSIMMALFIVPILALIIFYSQNQMPSNIDASIRADELRYLSYSIEKDLARFLQINGKRALVSAVNLTVATGKGLDNSSLRLAEMIENGTLYGTHPFLDEKNLSTWQKNISDIALSSGFIVNFSNFKASVIVTQNDSFSVLFNATLYNVNISDSTVKMGIFKNMSITEAISLLELNITDPLYSIKTNGTIFKNIKKSPYDKTNDPLNLVNLTSDIKNGYYHESNVGPSFLDRLEGKLSLSQEHGLESFVYLPDLTSPNVQSSVLDYQYWANTHGYLLNKSLQSDPIYSWFRMTILINDDYGLNTSLNQTT